VQETTETDKKSDLIMEQLPFSQVSVLLDTICSKRRPADKLELLQHVWTRFPHDNAFPLLRLFLPHLDHSRGVYGIKESGISKAYIAVLGLSDKSLHAHRLKNYKDPKFAKSGAAGDFGLAVLEVMRVRAPSVSQWTIAATNHFLDELATAQDAQSRKTLFARLASELTAKEQMWIVRIILKDMKLGIRHESILKHFHPKAMDVFNATSSLEEVCRAVLNPQLLKDFSMDCIVPMRPVRPMLAARTDWDKIIKLMKGSPIGIEIKFDGERLIIHKKGSEIRLFSRNSLDLTDRFGYGKVLLPIALRCIKCDSCILDGELVSWNSETESFEPFGTNRSIALSQSVFDSEVSQLASLSDSPDSPQSTEVAQVDEIDQQLLCHSKNLCYIAFDILYRNGESLVSKPLNERKRILQECIKTEPHRFDVAEYFVDGSTTEDIMAKLDWASSLQ